MNDLAGLQERLSKQYARLRDIRTPESYSVYAIEHGLSSEERAEARRLLNASLEQERRADRAHWLVWIAAAAEVGYGYDGTEYWDSFATAFPKWPQFGDRNQIRGWFKRFATEFNGLTPSGPWARQFPIIAWPITQAILPRYLQRHFAEHLYELRNVLARRGQLTLNEIGDLLCDRYYGSSSRFEGLLHQKALTSRLVMAMGQEDVADSVAPIEKATLERLVRDFDKLGGAGARLREARRVLRDARFINGSKPGTVSTGRVQAENGLAVEKVDRARLIALPVDETNWTLSLAIPDLATPLRQAGISPRDFDNAKMRFRPKGGITSWQPGRGLLAYSGSTAENLAVYPASEWEVFEFERPLEKATAIIAPRASLPSAPLRVLKIRSDGSAFEIAGRHVRANQSYLLASAFPFSDSIIQDLSLIAMETSTQGVRLWQFDIPQTLSAPQIDALKQLGLGYVLGIHIQPLGLTPRWNLANGSLVLLESEAAMFSLRSDIEVREYAISVDGAPLTRLRPSVGEPALISIGQLPVGNHRIIVSALGTATGVDLEADDVALEVREAEPWQRAVAGKAGVTFALEPRDATIEQLFDGAATIRMRAPQGRSVRLDCRYYAVDGTLFLEETLGRYATPITDERLSAIVVQKLTSDTQVENLERAARVQLAISLDEYGSETISFDKDAEPLRWVRLNDKTVRLSDDSAQETAPSVERYDLDAADKGHTVDYSTALDGIELRGKGSLLVAKLSNGRRYEAIATVMRTHLSSFTDLGVPARLSDSIGSAKHIINALKRWRSARRMMGPMAYMARQNAVRALEAHLERHLCGDNWSEAANAVRNGNKAIGDIYGLVFFSRGFASGLRSYQWRYEADRLGAEAEFIRLAHDVYKVSEDDALSKLALKLAFRPASVSPADLPNPDAFELLKAESSLVRGAYFARLAAELQSAASNSEAA